MKKTLIILLSIFLLSCSNKTDLNKSPIHENLIGFKDSFLAELGEEEYFKLEKKLNKQKLDIKYINDIIYVSFYEELNACGQYRGNLEYRGDTINLKIEQISDKVCTSTSIDRLTFLIDNPDQKKKIILKN